MNWKSKAFLGFFYLILAIAIAADVYAVDSVVGHRHEMTVEVVGKSYSPPLIRTDSAKADGPPVVMITEERERYVVVVESPFGTIPFEVSEGAWGRVNDGIKVTLTWKQGFLGIRHFQSLEIP